MNERKPVHEFMKTVENHFTGLNVDERQLLIREAHNLFNKALKQSSEARPHETIVKCPLPDVFEGELNTRRIEKYQEIKKRYMVSEGTVRDLFNAGIDWYKQIIEESGT